jgi:hypothetical protein
MTVLARLLFAAALAWLLLVAALAPLGCGGSRIPEPAYGPQVLPEDQWIDGLETPPPSVQAEEIHPAPSKAFVWVDGQWMYQQITKRWTWQPGAWCLPPPGAVYYAKPIAERRRVVADRVKRWNEALSRFEEVDSGDDVWRWAAGRFYVKDRQGVIGPTPIDPACAPQPSVSK